MVKINRYQARWDLDNRLGFIAIYVGNPEQKLAIDYLDASSFNALYGMLEHGTNCHWHSASRSVVSAPEVQI